MAAQLVDYDAQLVALPLSRHFSQNTWDALRRYTENGAHIHRSHRLLEFFKALDWLPLEEIHPNPLKQMSLSDAQRLKREISAYFSEKQSKRQTQREKREAYKLKVFEYFRAKVSAEDKALLESLRDYELERIGEDINWKHFFWFTSFKQIDAFVDQTPLQRQTLINRFKQDVELRFKNAERLRDGSYAQYYWGEGFESATESFDEWLNRQSQTNPDGFKAKPGRNGNGFVMLPREVQSAYARLQLAPSATLQEVRQQFRQLTLRFHPDMPGGSEDQMKAILAAYNMVKQRLKSC